MEIQINNIFEFFKKEQTIVKDPWLIFGKGPSFSLRNKFPIDNFQTLTLNDSVKYFNNNLVSIFIDFSAYERCREFLQKNKNSILAMPWYPHFNFKKGKYNLRELCEKYDDLREFFLDDRLFWFDLDNCKAKKGGFPTVTSRYFSSEAAIDILIKAGVSEIKSLGIDGGNIYSSEFTNISKESLLVNKQKSFDKQFSEIAKIINRKNINYSPLNHDNPIKVFVGCTERERLPFLVLKYSINYFASATTEIIPLYERKDKIPEPISKSNQQRSPFSFQRFLIPKACNYSGRAIYMDSDMLVFKDIMDLWRMDFNSSNVLTSYTTTKTGRLPQLSLMLLDNNSLNWDLNNIVKDLDSEKITYDQLMHEFILGDVDMKIDEAWNHLEKFEDSKTALLHYTDMFSQPWLSTQNPLGYKWIEMLKKSIEDSVISYEIINQEIQKGHVRPSLMYQLENNINDSLALPKKALALDKEFISHDQGYYKNKLGPWNNYILYFYAKFKNTYRNTSLYRYHRKLLKYLKNDR